MILRANRGPRTVRAGCWGGWGNDSPRGIGDRGQSGQVAGESEKMNAAVGCSRRFEREGGRPLNEATQKNCYWNLWESRYHGIGDIGPDIVETLDGAGGGYTKEPCSHLLATDFMAACLCAPVRARTTGVPRKPWSYAPIPTDR